MAHSHSHAQAHDGGTYVLDQLFTILACGALGLVAVLMYQTGMLDRVLVPMFFVPVLIGGSALLLLAAIRAVSIWQLAAKTNCDHSGHCDHSHTHSHGADHGHGPSGEHEHGWAPWRYLVLAIPVFLYFLDLPRAGGLSIPDPRPDDLQYGSRRQALAAVAGGPALTKALRKSEPRRLMLRFKELSEAAAVSARHEHFEGDIGIIRGQYIPLSYREFTLFRWHETCCKADAVPLNARIEAPEPVHGIGRGQWVEVQGIITFQQNTKGTWLPVITLETTDAVRIIEKLTDDSTGF